MLEYFTEAVVLYKEPIGEQDARVVLFTRELGRITAKIKSARKITSKLSGHFEPLDISQVRLITKNIFQIVDGLKIGRIESRHLPSLNLIKDISAEGQPDLMMWELLRSNRLSEEAVLKVSGFDPKFAECQSCSGVNHLKFSIQNLDYFCLNCFNEGNVLEA